MTTTRTIRPLLRARTTPPRASTHIMSRPRLIEQMDSHSRGAVTLVCGGPGSGKSHLAIDWVRRRRSPGVRVAWAALGADCNDPQRLWSLFLASLDRAGLDSPSLSGIRVPAHVNEAFLDRLLLALEELDAPMVMVLEDLHEVTAPAALHTIDTLVRMLPDCCHLVMITRSDPPLSLHRLRVSGGLSEIRHADLAFTRDEAVALLNQHGLTLSDDEVEQLMERTEGWAVGLRLAALSLQRCTDDAERAQVVTDFAGDSRAVADYLVAEVLDRLPEDLRRFLLLTSVVERVDAGLAEQLTGTSGGAEALERLETAGVPLIPLDDHRGWYRYHRLVQELCRQRLHAEDPALVTGLHTQAALWFAEHGEYDEGLRQALAARDWQSSAGSPWLGPGLMSSAIPAAPCGVCLPSFPRTSSRRTRGWRPYGPSSCTTAEPRTVWRAGSCVPRSCGPTARATTRAQRHGPDPPPRRGGSGRLRRGPGRGGVPARPRAGRHHRRWGGGPIPGTRVVPRVRRPAPGQEPDLAGSPGGG